MNTKGKSIPNCFWAICYFLLCISVLKANMDFITKSSGLHHILENVFMELDQEHLKICEKVHPIWRHFVLNKPLKWYKKLIQNCHKLTKKDKSDWMELIDKLICNCNPHQIQYMKQFFYDFSYRIDKFSSVSQEIYDAIDNGRDNFIQIIAPLIENFAALTYSSKCWICNCKSNWSSGISSLSKQW